MKILLVDDDIAVRISTQAALEFQKFEVVAASSVAEALVLINSVQFDVLITDLHMPGPADGFAVITAMRHAQPQVFSILISGYPDLEEAKDTIARQADSILTKPMAPRALAEFIRSHVPLHTRAAPSRKESVASILERDADLTVRQWLMRVAKDPILSANPLSEADRIAHLPEMLADIATRLRKVRVLEAVAIPSRAAVAHGEIRHLQRYTAPMMVQESRILQVCIFETIQRNLGAVDFSLVLPDIMLIADEVDSQLTQSIDSFLQLDHAPA